MHFKKIVLMKEISEFSCTDRKNTFFQIIFIILLSVILPIASVRSSSEMSGDLIFLRISLYSTLLTIFTFSLKIFFTERVQGTLAALLSTPVKLKDIIIGKALFLTILAAAVNILVQGCTLAYLIGNQAIAVSIGQLLIQVIIQTLFVIPFFSCVLSISIGFLTIKAGNNRTASLSIVLPSFIAFILINFLINRFEVLSVRIILVVLSVFFSFVICLLIKYLLNPENILYEKFSRLK